MWLCEVCNERLEDQFMACLKCGVARHSQARLGSNHVVGESPSIQPAEPGASGQLQRFQFNLRSMFLWLAGIAIFFALYRLCWRDPEMFWVSLTGIVLANLIGVFAGYTVTQVLGRPNDATVNGKQPE